MILNKLNQYKNLYLQASNENAHLKHAVSKHEDELEANRKTIGKSPLARMAVPI